MFRSRAISGKTAKNGKKRTAILLFCVCYVMDMECVLWIVDGEKMQVLGGESLVHVDWRRI